MQEIYFQNIHSVNNGYINIYQFGKEKIDPEVFCGPTFRKHFLIHLILDGKGVFKQSDCTYQLSRGQAFLITPNTKVYYQADKIYPWEYAWIEFDGAKACQYLSQAGLSQKAPIFTPKDPENDCQKHLLNIIVNHDNEIKILAYFLLFLDSIILNSSNPQRVPQRPDNYSELYIKRIIDYISLNYWKRITVEQLSVLCGINRSYLSRLFKQKVGLSPQEYIIQYKLEIACKLLYTTDLSISDIANSVGYPDQFAFCKIFKKYKGHSPSEWRMYYMR